MTDGVWNYPPELRDALAQFGLDPRPATPPALVRDALSDLYRHQLRRLRDRLLAGRIAKPDYVGYVVALRKRYWPLTMTPRGWEDLCR